jgi:hypothetical protein
LVTLKPFVIRFPIFILEIDPSYNAFIASINLVLIANPSRIFHNVFNGILSCGLKGYYTAMWKANGNSTTLLLFLYSLFPKTEIHMRDASYGDRTIRR